MTLKKLKLSYCKIRELKVFTLLQFYSLWLFVHQFHITSFSRIFLKVLCFQAHPILYFCYNFQHYQTWLAVYIWKHIDCRRQNVNYNFHGNCKIIPGNKCILLLLNQNFTLSLLIHLGGFYCLNWKEELGRRRQLNYDFSCLRKMQSFLQLENWALVWI